MNDTIVLRQLLVKAGQTESEQVEIFALLNLGILESLSHGLISAADALSTFYHAENCQFVRQQMRNRAADEIMSRGVQLSDLFDALPPLVAQRQFQHELAKMHALSLSLLEKSSRSPRRRRHRFAGGDGKRRTKQDIRSTGRRPQPTAQRNRALRMRMLRRGGNGQPANSEQLRGQTARGQRWGGGPSCLRRRAWLGARRPPLGSSGWGRERMPGLAGRGRAGNRRFESGVWQAKPARSRLGGDGVAGDRHGVRRTGQTERGRLQRMEDGNGCRARLGWARKPPVRNRRLPGETGSQPVGWTPPAPGPCGSAQLCLAAAAFQPAGGDRRARRSLAAHAVLPAEPRRRRVCA